MVETMHLLVESLNKIWHLYLFWFSNYSHMSIFFINFKRLNLRILLCFFLWIIVIVLVVDSMIQFSFRNLYILNKFRYMSVKSIYFSHSLSSMIWNISPISSTFWCLSSDSKFAYSIHKRKHPHLNRWRTKSSHNRPALRIATIHRDRKCLV